VISPAQLHDAALAALGGSDLTGLTFTGAGFDACLGQAWAIEEGWARWELTGYRRVINYDSGSSRHTAQRRAGLDPQKIGGCGAQPNARPAAQNGFIDTSSIWNDQLVIWLTPHGFLRLVAANSTVIERDGDLWRATLHPTRNGVTYTMIGRFDENHQLRSITTWVDDSVFGDMEVLAEFGDYRDFGALWFPATLSVKEGGSPTFYLAVESAVPSTQAVQNDLPRRNGAAPAAVAPLFSEIGPGVFVFYGGYQSVAVTFDDYAVVIDGLQSDARVHELLALVKQAIPGKPIRYVVSTHSHFDHASGLRQFAAEGATILTHQMNVAFFQRVLSRPRTLRGAAATEPAVVAVKVQGVTDRFEISDSAGQVLRLYALPPNAHAADMLIAYLPGTGTLVEADLLQPWINPAFAGDGGGPHPFLVQLATDLDRLGIEYEQFVPIHAPPNPPTMDRQALYLTGAELFERACAACHGGNGRGGQIAPSLLPRVASEEDVGLLAFLRTGNPERGMPPAALADTELPQLIAHLRFLVATADEVETAVVSAERRPRNRVVENFRPLDEKNLLDPDPADWLGFSRQPDAQNFSPLNQITTSNVRALGLAWARGLPNALRDAIPLVHNGVMYLATSESNVMALDATTGDLIWEYRRVDADTSIGEPGRAKTLLLLDDLLYFMAPDSTLVALEAASGEARSGTLDPDNEKLKPYYPYLAGDTTNQNLNQEHRLTTAGNLTFEGGSEGDGERYYRAKDTGSGARLWQTTLSGPILGGNITYAAQGRQYVTVSVGVSTGEAALYVFALPVAQAAFAPVAAPKTAGVSIGHAHFVVPDTARQAAIWQSLGAEPVAVEEIAVGEMAVGEIEILQLPGISLWFSPGEARLASPQTSANHLGFSVRDYAEYKAKLQENGATFFYDSADNGQILADLPGGIRVEILVDKNQSQAIVFHHLHVAAHDTVALRDWYMRVFGAEAGERRGLPSALLPQGRIDMLGINGSAPQPSHDGAFDHIGFEVADLAAFAQTLEEQGLRVDVEPSRGNALGLTRVFLTDPAGTSIEVSTGLSNVEH
jgi:glyoxylase-like metal-dependent hydrolase (beta-lactamase superfamily II)/catechol 2,3-dioxygenase-like lactoylglutathione lyase family enzyme